MAWPEAPYIGLPVVLVMAVGGWLWSLPRHNVTIVDSLWPLFFLACAVAYALSASADANTARAALVLTLIAVWALRLSLYLAWRNHGRDEDHRYRAIRARNEPGFAWKSVYLIFALQALLAWVISAPQYAAIDGSDPLGALDALAVALWLAGFGFQSTADAQLARFRRDPANRDRVLDTGLWRYTRHPNYFGEFCMAWAYWLFACAAGGAWSVFAPILMTVLLLRVSGVALLEKDIGVRRPAYADYVARTNAFVPGPPRPRTARP